MSKPKKHTQVERIRFAAGDVLMTQGEIGGHAVVIESGEVQILVARDQVERLVALAGAGEIVGEMALIDNEPRSATVTAITDCVCRVVPGDLFRAELAQSTLLIHSVTEILTRHLRRMDHL